MKFARRFLSLFLALMMAATLCAGLGVTASAKDEEFILDGTVTVSGEAAVGKTLTAAFQDKSSPPAPAGDVKYQWQRVPTSLLDQNDGVDRWSDINGATGKTYTPTQDDVGYYLRAKVTATDYVNYAASSKVKVAKPANTAMPVAPELAYRNYKIVVTNARPDQEYFISTRWCSKADLAILWPGGWPKDPAASGDLVMSDSVPMAVNYVYTRFRENNKTTTGTEYAVAYLYCGETVLDLKLYTYTYSMTLNSETGVYNAYEDDVLELTAVPLNNSAAAVFPGVYGKDWKCALPDGSAYGQFYADSACKTPIDSYTQYKSVYIPLSKPANHIAFSAAFKANSGEDSTVTKVVNVGYAGWGGIIVVLDDLKIPDVTIAQGTREYNLPIYPDPLEAYKGEDLLSYHCSSNNGTPPVAGLSGGLLYVNAEKADPGEYFFEADYEQQDGSVKTMCYFKVTVTEKGTSLTPEKLTLSPSMMTLAPGGTAELTAVISPAGAKAGTITWKSSDPSVASVDSSGKVTVPSTAKTGYTATISAAAGSLTDVCTITVGEAQQANTDVWKVHFDPNGGGGSSNEWAEVKKGDKLTLPACPFTAPEGMEFDRWDAGVPGTSIDVTSDMEIKALWKEKGKQNFAFLDVSPQAWYYNDVKYAFDSGLINGRSPTEYAPGANMTFAEAVKLAACMNQLYTTGSVTLTNGSGKWYDSYVQYARDKNIITKDYDWSADATRAGYVEIFANALPAEAFAVKNSIADGKVPDVPMSHPQAPSIYKLYRAGILNGSDSKGTFNPDNKITRAEVSAILTRMMNADARKSLTL